MTAFLPDEICRRRTAIPHIYAARVLALRRNFGLERQTSVVTIEKLFDQPLLEGIAAETKKRMTPRFRRWVLHPEFPEYREPLYVLVNALKAAFVNTAIDLDLVHTAQSAWVDFGYCHDDERFDPGESWRFDAGDRMNLFYLTELDELPIYRIVRYGTVYFQGCHVVGPTSAWRSFAKEIARAHDALLGSDLVDDDQTLMLMAWRRDPTQYRIHGVTSDDWRVWCNCSRLLHYRSTRQGQLRPATRRVFVGDMDWWSRRSRSRCGECGKRDCSLHQARAHAFRARGRVADKSGRAG